MKASILKAVAFGLAIATMSSSAPLFAKCHTGGNHHCFQARSERHQNQIRSAVQGALNQIVDNLQEIFQKQADVRLEGGDPDPFTNANVAAFISAEIGVDPITLQPIVPTPFGSILYQRQILADIFVNRLGIDPALVDDIGIAIGAYVVQAGLFSTYVAVNPGDAAGQTARFNEWLATAAGLADLIKQTGCFSNNEKQRISNAITWLVINQAQSVLGFNQIVLTLPNAVADDQEAHDDISSLGRLIVDQLLKDCHRHNG